MRGEYHNYHIAGKLPLSLGMLLNKVMEEEGLTPTYVVNTAIKVWLQCRDDPNHIEPVLDFSETSILSMLDNYSREEGDQIAIAVMKANEKKKFLPPEKGGYKTQRKVIRLQEQESIRKAQELKKLSNQRHGQSAPVPANVG